MSYYCEKCNYSTDNQGNFSHHKKTKKHLKNLKDNCLNKTTCITDISCSIINISSNDSKTTCDICNKIFKHQSNYYRHKKTCKSKQEDVSVYSGLIEKEKELLEYKMKLEMAEKEKEIIKKIEKEKTELLNNFMTNANVLLNKANDNTKITAQTLQTMSMSAIKYANEKFKDTPALLPLNNFNINNLSFDNLEDRKQLTEILVYNAKQKSLDKLLGDHIVKCYKKDNPKEQTFHTTDCSRLNYIVRELIENALIWSIDKNGIKICSSIIKPLIEKCIGILLEHQQELLDKMADGEYNNKGTIQTIISVLMSIDKGEL